MCLTCKKGSWRNAESLSIVKSVYPSAGVLSWPPTASRDVPDDWGAMPASTEVIPEGLTIGVMVLLPSVAVIVSSRYFRKQPKIKSYNQVKL